MKYHKLLITILIAFQFLPSVKLAANEIDSLKMVLKSNVADTTMLNTVTAIASKYIYIEPDSAIVYTKIAIELSKKENNLLKLAYAYSIMGACHILNINYSKGQLSLTKALNISKQLLKTEPDNSTYQRMQSDIYIRFGYVYYYQGKYDLAINDFFNAIKLLEDMGDEHGVGTCLSNISVIYEALDDFSKAVEYNQKALSVVKNSDVELLAQISNNLCVDYIRLGNYDSAYYHISKCIKINEEAGDNTELLTNYLNLSRVFSGKSNYDSALFYLNLSLNISKQLNSIVGIIDVNYLMGKVYLDKKNYDKSEKHFKESMTFAQEAGITNSVKNATSLLSDVYKAKGDYKKAYEYFVAGSQIRDSIFNEESDARIADMEIKYQSEKKEEEIKLLQEIAKLNEATTKTNRIVFSAIIVILVLIIILVIMSYRSYKQKQLTEQIKIKQNAERKVLDAVIETEYKERKRFAEDLHDGLGVLLSTTRLYINEIEDSNKEERKSLIKQSNSMLDDAIANARNISNNIMPAALKNNGLEIAIRSFSDKINSSGNLKIAVKSVNFKKHYKNTIEITIYRILTEMINNTIKHAEATLVNISLTEKDDKLFVTYNDNGKGFDYEAMIKSTEKGMGLDNTISRINSISGLCSINSKIGKGFFAKIEVSLNNT